MKYDEQPERMCSDWFRGGLNRQTGVKMLKKSEMEIIEDLVRRYPALACIAGDLERVFHTLTAAFASGHTLYLCGNGGSACDGEHITGELLKCFRVKRAMPDELKQRFADVLGDEDISGKLEMGFRAISLNNHPGVSSAYMNDVDPLMIYAQQLFAMGREGDVLIGISTSGGAKNIYNAFKTAKVMGVSTILLTGEKCGICEKYADIRLKVPAKETYQVQEYHLPVYHALCYLIEEHFYGAK